LKALADSLRAETDGTGVRVTTVFPGRTATPMQQEVHRMEGREYDGSAFMGPEHVAESILHALEIARSANVVDLSIR
jgi:short-subunit dehydrogenase